MQNPFVAHALDNVREAPTDLIYASAQAVPKKWKLKKDPKSGSLITDDRLRVKMVPQEGSSNEEAIHPDVFALGDCGLIE
jgi:hypothetical protein